MSFSLHQRLTRALIAALALGACLTSNAQTGSQWCQSTLANPYVDWDGGLVVFANFRGDYLRLCSLRATSVGNGVSIDPVTCVGWFSLIRQAVSSNKSVVIRYDNAPACNALPNYYSAPFPSYVMLN